MFYEILKNLCSQKDTTPTALLKKMGLSTSKVTAWKNGSCPNGEVLIKLADYLNCSVDYLLGRDKYVTPQPQEQAAEIKKVPLSEDEGIKMYIQLDETDKAEIRGEMKHMLKAEKYAKDSGTKMA